MNLFAVRKRAATAAALLLLCLCLGGCRRLGPDASRLKTLLQRRLDDVFGGGAFVVESLDRMGSQPQGDAAAVVYFKAKVVLGRELDTSRWNRPGMDEFMLACGCASKGVEGLKPGLNPRGTVLRVYGTMVFAKDGDGKWKPVPRGADGGAGSATASGAGGMAAMCDELEQARKALRQAEGRLRNVVDRITVKGDVGVIGLAVSSLDELSERLARECLGEQGLRLAAGEEGGVYYALCRALAFRLEVGAGLAVKVLRTGGSADNCRLVEEGVADLAVVQNDMADAAWKGTGPFEGRACRRLAVLCAWFPEPVQVLVRKDSRYRSVEDLAGARIVVGERGSGSRFNAMQVLREAGLLGGDPGAERRASGSRSSCILVEADHEKGLGMLQRGEVDAVFFTEAYPPPALRRAMRGGLRMLSLGHALCRKLARKYPFYTVVTLTPAGLDEKVVTVSVVSLFVARADLPGGTVRTILSTLYADLKFMMRAHPKAALISLKNARKGVTIPMHPAAEEFIRKRLRETRSTP